jgi:caspase domain-containing protein
MRTLKNQRDKDAATAASTEGQSFTHQCERSPDQDLETTTTTFQLQINYEPVLLEPESKSRFMHPTSWLVIILVLHSGAVAVAATGPAELRKLHALLVVDTLSGLGESVAVDGNRIEDMLRSGVPRDRLDLTLLTGKDVTSARVLDYFQNLKAGPDDGLLFFYAGHGATDPEKGHFQALQKLDTTPLFRSDLKRSMSSHRPGLIVILTDCCSTRYPLGKKRRVSVIPGLARKLDPILHCLLFQHRGVVDVTATSEGAAFGDDEEGGLFTRTLARTIQKHSDNLARAPDGFVTWAELFQEVQSGTVREFSHWSRNQQARGANVEQKTQKPRAFDLPRDPTRPSVTMRNGTMTVVRYRCRWRNEGEWEQVVMSPDGGHLHLAPTSHTTAESPFLNVEFENGEAATLVTGKTYKFNSGPRKSRGLNEADH